MQARAGVGVWLCDLAFDQFSTSLLNKNSLLISTKKKKNTTDHKLGWYEW